MQEQYIIIIINMKYTRAQQAANLLKAKKEKPKIGSGKRFEELTGELKKKGVKDPGALAAWAGRQKYGKAAFQKLSKGRK